MARARCIQECFHGPNAWKFTPDGGEGKDGYYDIDPMDPIAAYFEFPKGTKKYDKKKGFVFEGGEEIPEEKTKKKE